MNQEQIVLNHLEKHGSITSLEAFKKYGITRLSARIFNLKKNGYDFPNIFEHSEETGTKYKRYFKPTKKERAPEQAHWWNVFDKVKDKFWKQLDGMGKK